MERVVLPERDASARSRWKRRVAIVAAALSIVGCGMVKIEPLPEDLEIEIEIEKETDVYEKRPTGSLAMSAVW